MRAREQHHGINTECRYEPIEDFFGTARARVTEAKNYPGCYMGAEKSFPIIICDVCRSYSPYCCNNTFHHVCQFG